MGKEIELPPMVDFPKGESTHSNPTMGQKIGFRFILIWIAF
jgi:hypothetical protein